MGAADLEDWAKNPNMKITPHHKTYLCLTKLAGDDRARFLTNLESLSHFVVNEALAVVVFEGDNNALVNQLFREITNEAGITLIPFGSSQTILGATRNSMKPTFGNDMASVFDK